MPATVQQVRLVAWSVLLVLAALQGWFFRHVVSPDGVAYLDLSDAVVHWRLGELVNGYWSPLYPALVGLLRLLVSNPYWEFALMHLASFLGFALSLAAFEWFLRALDDAGATWGQQPFRTPLGRAVAYVFFGTLSLVMISVAGTVPDFFVSAAVFAALACLVRLRENPADRSTAVRLGGVLALGALTKSIMFPFGVVVILTLALATWTRAGRTAVLRSAAVLAVATMPWFVALSVSLGRPSLGEAGTLNYAWYVNDQQPPNSGVMPAAAAAREPLPLGGLAVVPDGRGTNPLWLDPVRFHSGARPRFSLGQQLTRLSASLGYYVGVMAPLLFVIVVIGASADPLDVRTTLSRGFVVLIPCLAALGAYALVYMLARYVAPYLIAVCVALAAAFPRHAKLHPGRLALAVAAALLAIDVLSPVRGRVFLTYGLALFLIAWLAWRSRPPVQRVVLSIVTALALLGIVALLPGVAVRVAILAAGIILWLKWSRAPKLSSADDVSLSVARALAVASVVVMVLVNAITGWHSIANWRAATRDDAHPEWSTAQRLIQSGIPAGAKIAVLGNPDDAGWARLARYRIVGVIPHTQVDAFLKLSPEDRARVMRAFSSAGAVTLVTRTLP